MEKNPVDPSLLFASDVDEIEWLKLERTSLRTTVRSKSRRLKAATGDAAAQVGEELRADNERMLLINKRLAYLQRGLKDDGADDNDATTAATANGDSVPDQPAKDAAVRSKSASANKNWEKVVGDLLGGSSDSYSYMSSDQWQNNVAMVADRHKLSNNADCEPSQSDIATANKYGNAVRCDPDSTSSQYETPRSYDGVYKLGFDLTGGSQGESLGRRAGGVGVSTSMNRISDIGAISSTSAVNDNRSYGAAVSASHTTKSESASTVSAEPVDPTLTFASPEDEIEWLKQERVLLRGKVRAAQRRMKKAVADDDILEISNSEDDNKRLLNVNKRLSSLQEKLGLVPVKPPTVTAASSVDDRNVTVAEATNSSGGGDVVGDSVPPTIPRNDGVPYKDDADEVDWLKRERCQLRSRLKAKQRLLKQAQKNVDSGDRDDVLMKIADEVKSINQETLSYNKRIDYLEKKLGIVKTKQPPQPEKRKEPVQQRQPPWQQQRRDPPPPPPPSLSADRPDDWWDNDIGTVLKRIEEMRSNPGPPGESPSLEYQEAKLVALRLCKSVICNFWTQTKALFQINELNLFDQENLTLLHEQARKMDKELRDHFINDLIPNGARKDTDFLQEFAKTKIIKPITKETTFHIEERSKRQRLSTGVGVEELHPPHGAPLTGANRSSRRAVVPSSSTSDREHFSPSSLDRIWQQSCDQAGGTILKDSRKEQVVLSFFRKIEQLPNSDKWSDNEKAIVLEQAGKLDQLLQALFSTQGIFGELRTTVHRDFKQQQALTLISYLIGLSTVHMLMRSQKEFTLEDPDLAALRQPSFADWFAGELESVDNVLRQLNVTVVKAKAVCKSFGEFVDEMYAQMRLEKTRLIAQRTVVHDFFRRILNQELQDLDERSFAGVTLVTKQARKLNEQLAQHYAESATLSRELLPGKLTKREVVLPITGKLFKETVEQLRESNLSQVCDKSAAIDVLDAKLERLHATIAYNSTPERSPALNQVGFSSDLVPTEIDRRLKGVGVPDCWSSSFRDFRSRRTDVKTFAHREALVAAKNRLLSRKVIVQSFWSDVLDWEMGTMDPLPKQYLELLIDQGLKLDGELAALYGGDGGGEGRQLTEVTALTAAATIDDVVFTIYDETMRRLRSIQVSEEQRRSRVSNYSEPSRHSHSHARDDSRRFGPPPSTREEPPRPPSLFQRSSAPTAAPDAEYQRKQSFISVPATATSERFERRSTERPSLERERTSAEHVARSSSTDRRSSREPTVDERPKTFELMSAVVEMSGDRPKVADWSATIADDPLSSTSTTGAGKRSAIDDTSSKAMDWHGDKPSTSNSSGHSGRNRRERSSSTSASLTEERESRFIDSVLSQLSGGGGDRSTSDGKSISCLDYWTKDIEFLTDDLQRSKQECRDALLAGAVDNKQARHISSYLTEREKELWQLQARKFTVSAFWADIFPAQIVARRLLSADNLRVLLRQTKQLDSKLKTLYAGDQCKAFTKSRDYINPHLVMPLVDKIYKETTALLGAPSPPAPSSSSRNEISRKVISDTDEKVFGAEKLSPEQSATVDATATNSVAMTLSHRLIDFKVQLVNLEREAKRRLQTDDGDGGGGGGGVAGDLQKLMTIKLLANCRKQHEQTMLQLEQMKRNEFGMQVEQLWSDVRTVPGRCIQAEPMSIPASFWDDDSGRREDAGDSSTKIARRLLITMLWDSVTAELEKRSMYTSDNLEELLDQCSKLRYKLKYLFARLSSAYDDDEDGDGGDDSRSSRHLDRLLKDGAALRLCRDVYADVVQRVRRPTSTKTAANMLDDLSPWTELKGDKRESRDDDRTPALGRRSPSPPPRASVAKASPPIATGKDSSNRIVSSASTAVDDLLASFINRLHETKEGSGGGSVGKSGDDDVWASVLADSERMKPVASMAGSSSENTSAAFHKVPQQQPRTSAADSLPVADSAMQRLESVIDDMMATYDMSQTKQLMARYVQCLEDVQQSRGTQDVYLRDRFCEPPVWWTEKIERFSFERSTLATAIAELERHGGSHDDLRQLRACAVDRQTEIVRSNVCKRVVERFWSRLASRLHVNRQLTPGRLLILLSQSRKLNELLSAAFARNGDDGGGVSERAEELVRSANVGSLLTTVVRETEQRLGWVLSDGLDREIWREACDSFAAADRQPRETVAGQSNSSQFNVPRPQDSAWNADTQPMSALPVNHPAMNVHPNSYSPFHAPQPPFGGQPPYYPAQPLYPTTQPLYPAPGTATNFAPAPGFSSETKRPRTQGYNMY